MDDSTKKIIIIEERQKKVKIVKTEKPKKKRIITASVNWETAIKELEEADVDEILNHPDDNNTCKIILQQVKKKIAGYIVQDRRKNRVNKELFVNVQDVINLFKTSEMNCYYCKEKAEIMYEYVREPKQWTLERLDNSLGHNRGNVVIACLSCNLRRRTMAKERYLQTKAMANIVKLDA